MVTELIAWHRFTAYNIPLKSPDHGIQVLPEHRSKAKQVWNPAHYYRPVLQNMRVDGNPQYATALVNGRDSPGYG